MNSILFVVVLVLFSFAVAYVRSNPAFEGNKENAFTVVAFIVMGLAIYANVFTTG